MFSKVALVAAIAAVAHCMLAPDPVLVLNCNMGDCLYDSYKLSVGWLNQAQP